jgi:hypothetical protein
VIFQLLIILRSDAPFHNAICVVLAIANKLVEQENLIRTTFILRLFSRDLKAKLSDK